MKSNQYPIDHTINFPEPRSRVRNTLMKMRPGDSVLVPDTETARSYWPRVARKLGLKLAIRKDCRTQTQAYMRIWCVSRYDTKGAFTPPSLAERKA